MQLFSCDKEMAKWSNMSPSRKQRTQMLKKCGKKCFLGTKKRYPICAKNTCKINKLGLHAAYVRSRQRHKSSISRKAKKMLNLMK